LQQMLREMVAAAEQQHNTLQQREAEIDKLKLLIKRPLRQQFGRRSEQLSADQLQLALDVTRPFKPVFRLRFYIND
jgi:transposase